mmetsp:Transcript_22507/g.49030  ORF Transcript_22507/g.49030 Transcript_22507/m.49030 type:complete len:822 (-) Transcript_22507:94-2559(-)
MKIEVIGETTFGEEDDNVKNDNDAIDDDDQKNAIRVVPTHKTMESPVTPNGTLEELAHHAMTAIVQHYCQPIHYHSILQPEAEEEDQPRHRPNDASLPPVLSYWWEQMMNNDNNNDNSHDDDQRLLAVAQLLSLYPNYIHPMLLSNDPRGSAAVLTHVELLLRHGMDHSNNTNHNNTRNTTGNINNNTRNSQLCQRLFQVLRLLASDITQQTQRAVHFLAAANQETNDDDDNENAPTLDALLPDQEPAWQSKKDAQQVAQEKKSNLHYHRLTKTVILPNLIRMLQHAWHATATLMTTRSVDDGNARNEEEWQTVQAHCAVVLLSFRSGPLGPRRIYPQCVDAIENMNVFVADGPSRGNNDDDDDDKTTLMQWNELELVAGEWTSESLQETLGSVWNTLNSRHVPKKNAEETTPLPTLQNAQRQFLFPMAERRNEEDVVSIRTSPPQQDWLLQLARACRALVFGRDMYTTQQPPPSIQGKISSSSTANRSHDAIEVIPCGVETQTRLHLGRTITEEKQQPEKPYQQIPSRVFAVAQWMSLLPEHHILGDHILSELWPILYDLLSAHRSIYMGLGATVLCRLLQMWKYDDTVSNEERRQVLENFRNLLESAIKTVRESAVVTMLGVALQAVYEFNPPQLDRPYRLRALQQWFTVLNQNQTLRLPFSWACLVSGVLPNLHWFVLRAKNSGSELGRLGLMALLPLIQMESMSQDAIFGSPFTNEVQWLSLMAFSNLLVVANTVIPRHGAKIMSALLVCQGDEPRDQRTQTWAPYVSAMALSFCGSRGEELVNEIIQSGEYQDLLVQVAENMKKDAIAVDQSLTCR